jgi:TPR repeat protein
MLIRIKLSGVRVYLALMVLAIAGCVAISPQAQLQESIRWYTGESGRVDDSRARRLLEQSAEDGNALSVMWLSRVYSTGRMTFSADKPRALRLADSVIGDIEMMANQGDSEAMLLMGTAFAEGLGKEVNPELAVSWYRKAAEKNNTLALHNLGNVYASGTGVPQNDELAAQWWLRAANKGDAIPALRLGTVYEQGKGIDKDIDKAIYWYTESARRGNRAAAAALERLSGQN